MKTFLLGLVVGIVVAVAVFFGYFLLGIAPAATSASPIPFEKTLAHAALNARIKSEMPKDPPTSTPTEAQLLDGADVYAKNCAVCHGVPGGEKSSIAAGMYPSVPQLFKHGVDDDPAGETYWKVKNGIRLTGMPGYEKTLTEAQLWDVTYVLGKKFEALPSAVQTALRTPPTPQVQAPPPATPQTQAPTDASAPAIAH